MSCPNTNLPEWKLLVASEGEDVAYALWDLHDGNVPEDKYNQDIPQDLIPEIEELNNFVLYEDRDKLCAGGICNYTAGRSTEKLQEVGLNPFPNPASYGGDTLPVSVKSPLGDFFITHYVAASAINDSIYIYDMPQGEFISDEDFGMGSVSLKTAFKPRLIPLTIDSIKANYNLDSENAAKFIRSVLNRKKTNINPDFRSYISNNIKDSEQYIKSLEDQISSEGVMLDSREEFLLKEKSLEELRNKQKEEKLNKPITGKEENKVINFLRNKLKLKTREYLPTKSTSFTLGNIIKSVTGLDFEYSRENLDDALAEFKNYLESENFLIGIWNQYNSSKRNLEKLNESIDKIFYTKRLLNSFFKQAKSIGIDNALLKFDKNQQYQLRTFLPADIKTRYASEKQAIFMLEKSFSNLDTISKILNINFGKSFNDVIKEKFKLNAKYQKANTILNYLKALNFDVSYIYESIENEAKRRYAYFEKQGNVMFQSEDMAASKASEETVAMMRAAAEQMGIDIQDLLDYAKANPSIDVKNVNGLANLMKGAVAIAQGKEGVALVEEIVHLTTAMLEQTDPKLITELISKIDRFKIYKQVLEVYSKKKEYQLANGKPNIRKIKKEAVDKLISEVVVYQSEGSTEYPELMEEETRNMIQKLWDMILDKLRSVYRKSNIDIFQTAGTIVKSGKAGTVADIKTEGIYLQLDDTVKNKIENYFNKVKDYAKEMVYNPEIKDASGNITQKRGYTFKGERVATTITEKIKKNKKFPERTPEQKASDDEKKDWGDAGHAFQQNDLETNFIDKATGLAYATPLNNTINSTLPLDIQKQLHNFNRELIASYPAGTRFLVEEMVVNTKEKGMIGSRVDFKAIYPVQKKDGTWDMKIDTLDWKFTTVDKTLYDDISRDKIKDWVPQMGQFVAIDYTYGANQTQIGKARMIPFILNYNYKIAGDKKSGLYPESMEVGKLNSLEETNLYLLPVPIITETTGNEAVDKLIISLQAQWDKLWNKKTPFAEKDKKIADLAELSKAIRFLHLKLDFEPLVNVGKTFLNNAADTLKEFNNIKFAELNDVELNKKLEDLISYKEGAKKYADLGDTFLSYYPRKTLTKEGQKILDDLTNISRATDNMLKEIDKLQKQFVVEIALREKFTTEDTQLSVLDAEASIVGMSKSFLESSKLSSMIINLTTNLIMVAKKVVDGKVRKQIKQFGDALIPLEKEARARGVKAFDMIATKSKDGMSLIKKINPDFWVKVNKAKENKDKKFFLDNVNLDEYNALAKTAIEQRISDASKRQYASDPETNERYKQFAIDAINNALNLTSDSFNGYNDKTFGYLFSKSFKQDKNYSKEYIEMSKSKAALDVWNIFTKLNERAEGMGYLGEYKDSFFPLIEATILEKFYQTSSITGQTKDFFQDFYKIKVNEEQQFSKNDPETGKVKLVIPKLFTKTDKAIEQLSTDLNKVGTLWIKSIEEYENKKNLESQLLTLHSIEAAKGSAIIENGKVVFEPGSIKPKVNLDENKNADLLKVIINDYLYNLTENQNSLGNITISAAASKLGKTEEGAEKVEVATKKIIATADTWVQSLAVGLKPAIAIANWFGNQFTAYIQAGGFYNFWTDFEKNNIKVTTGKLTTVERGLLDLIHPLNEDVSAEERRKLAWKQGYIEYLSTWSFTDVMQITNSFPERKLQYANALSFIDNSIVINGEIKNIRKYLKAQDRITRKGMSESERKTLEKSFESRVTELKNAPNALKNIAKIEDGEMVIPGVSDLNVAKFSLTVSEYARTLNGQMSLTNKADYRRDAMFSSFMMFKNWIPKLVTARGMDIKKNVELDTWEYGRTRAFFKTVAFLGKSNISLMIDIINGTDKGLKILDELLEAKKLEHYKRTGQELDITQEEFYDLMREQLQNQVKELKLLLGLLLIVFAAAAAEPPEDATDAEKNAYKWYAKTINKISDEVSFYYNPISFESITKGSLLPSVGLLSKAFKIVDQVATEGYGIATDNEEMMEKAHGIKYTLNIIPGLSQGLNEILPYTNPELAKKLGVRVSKEARR